MQTFNSPVEVANALQDFLIDRTAEVPEPLYGELRAALKDRSTVVVTCQLIELVYGREQRMGDVPAELKDLAAGAAMHAEDLAFHGLDQDFRGSKIARVLRGQRIAEADVPEPDEAIAERAAPSQPVDEEAPIEPLDQPQG